MHEKCWPRTWKMSLWLHPSSSWFADTPSIRIRLDYVTRRLVIGKHEHFRHHVSCSIESLFLATLKCFIKLSPPFCTQVLQFLGTAESWFCRHWLSFMDRLWHRYTQIPLESAVDQRTIFSRHSLTKMPSFMIQILVSCWRHHCCDARMPCTYYRLVHHLWMVSVDSDPSWFSEWYSEGNPSS